MSARWGTISDAMEHFAEELRRLRQASGISLRSLAELVAFDYSYLAQVERGTRPGSVKLAQRCDEALGTGGRRGGVFRAPRGAPGGPCGNAAAARGTTGDDGARRRRRQSAGRAGGDPAGACRGARRRPGRGRGGGDRRDVPARVLAWRGRPRVSAP